MQVPATSPVTHMLRNGFGHMGSTTYLGTSAGGLGAASARRSRCKGLPLPREIPNSTARTAAKTNLVRVMLVAPNASFCHSERSEESLFDWSLGEETKRDSSLRSE